MREDSRFNIEGNNIFKPLKKDKFKVTIDDRFKGALSDEKFNSVHEVKGKKSKKNNRKNELLDLYNFDNDENDNHSLKNVTEKVKRKGCNNNNQSGKTYEDRLDYLNKLSRGEISEASSESDNGGDDVYNDEDSEAGDESYEEGNFMEDGLMDSRPLQIPGDDDVPMGEPTSRLALVHCQWQRLKALDLMMVLQSFCPAGIAIRSVTVYPSDFGLQAMSAESSEGPKGIWSELNEPNAVADKRNDSDSVDNGSESAGNQSDPQKSKNIRKSSAFNAEALRAYELSKLRYYFAVVECDSKATASILYDRMDGLEFEHSSMAFDLRFIPDDISFEGREIRDKCTGNEMAAVVNRYTPPDFIIQAMQHTNVECSWDEGEKEREVKLGNMSKWRALQESDFQQYIASDNSSEEEDDEITRRKRQLLLGDNIEEDEEDDFFAPQIDEKDVFNGDSDVHKVATFIPDFKSSLNDRKQLKVGQIETPFEKKLKEMSDSKMKKKQSRKNKKSSNVLDDIEEPINPTLDLMFDGEVEGDYNLRDIVKEEKNKSKKKKNKRRASAVDDDAGEFSVNLEDSRFLGLLNKDGKYGIDPSSADFQETPAMKKILKEQRKRSKAQL